MENEFTKLKEDLKQIRLDLTALKGRPIHNGTMRPGLYAMVTLALVSTIIGAGNTRILLEENVKSLESSIKAVSPVLKETDGQKFYEIDGKKAYLEINGKPAHTNSTNNFELTSE